MKSSTGVMTRFTRGFRPAQMPSGMPMTSAMSTAAMVSASVSMLSSHSPCRPKKTNPATARTATRTLPTTHET